MTNLLKETLECFEANKVAESDIVWIGSREYEISWDAFKALANREYDDGFGAAQVSEDLVIVGKSWWMTRSEYDGSEWWSFHTKFKRPENKLDVKKIFIENYEHSLAELNGVKP